MLYSYSPKLVYLVTGSLYILITFNLSPTPQPGILTKTNLFSVTWVGFLNIPHVSEIIQSLSFTVWLILNNIGLASQWRSSPYHLFSLQCLWTVYITVYVNTCSSESPLRKLKGCTLVLWWDLEVIYSIPTHILLARINLVILACFP